MPIILIIDDHPFTRLDAISALDDAGFKIRTLTDVNRTDPMIEAEQPDLVLINRQPADFDSVRIFTHIREKYPHIPVLHYALKSDTGIRSLHQSIRMAMNESRAASRRRKLPELRMLTSLSSFETRGRALVRQVDLPIDFIKR